MSTAKLARRNVVVVGGANTDISGRPENPLIAHDSNPGSITRSPGGVARNIAENLARLGVRPTLITAFGADAEGRELERACRAARIDTTPSLVCGDLPGSVYLAILDEEGDMALAVSDMRPLDRLSVRVVQTRRPLLQAAELVVADTNLPQETLEWLAEAASGKLMVDLVSVSKAQRAVNIVPHLAAVKGNAIEAAAVLGLESADEDADLDLESLALGLVSAGAKIAFVTAGTQGVWFARGSEAFWQAAPQVEIVSATGAGDAFSAGVVAGMLKGDTLERTAQVGRLLAQVTLASQQTVSEQVSPSLLQEAEKEWDE